MCGSHVPRPGSARERHLPSPTRLRKKPEKQRRGRRGGLTRLLGHEHLVSASAPVSLPHPFTPFICVFPSVGRRSRAQPPPARPGDPGEEARALLAGVREAAVPGRLGPEPRGGRAGRQLAKGRGRRGTRAPGRSRARPVPSSLRRARCRRRRGRPVPGRPVPGAGRKPGRRLSSAPRTSCGFP